MRQFLIAFCVAIAVFASTPAFATNDSRAFPPDNCSAGSPFMGFTGVANSNTFCNSGQDILTNALISSNPTNACSAGQIVAYDGSKFVCKLATAGLPTCTPNEFLTFDGQTYTCKSTGVATCGNNQVLTFNGTSYFCVNKDASIPNCAANQFLTYNGSYTCASVATPAPLNIGCPSGQALTGISNNQPVCAVIASTPTTPATLGDCELDAYTMQGLGTPGQPTFYLHRNKDGTLLGADGIPLLLNNPYYPATYVASMKPTGWQDTIGYATGGTFLSGTTCGPGANGFGSSCYTCVNGNWSQYQSFTPVQEPSYNGGG